MMNRQKESVYVLPEDDANRQMANGFNLGRRVFTRNFDVLPVAGGWKRALEQFESNYVGVLKVYPKVYLILLIDFDGRDDRLAAAKKCIPEELTNRVFVLGVQTTPEELKKSLNSTFENIGKRLAHECEEGTSSTWDHDLLRHNGGELQRLRNAVASFLFRVT